MTFCEVGIDLTIHAASALLCTQVLIAHLRLRRSGGHTSLSPGCPEHAIRRRAARRLAGLLPRPLHPARAGTTAPPPPPPASRRSPWRARRRTSHPSRRP